MGKIKREQERVSHFLMLKQMKKKYPKAKFTKHAYDKHRRSLAELPEKVAQRQQNIFNRNQMLASTQAYNLSLENRGSQTTSVTLLPLQKAMAQHHMGDLDKRMHRLAPTGLPH